MDRLDSETYNQMIENEKKHYSKLLEQQDKTDKIQAIEPKIDVFKYAYQQFSPHIRNNMGHHDFNQYILDFIKNKNRQIKILSLGSGTADWEIELMSKEPTKISCDVVDINEELLEKAKEHAIKNNLHLNIIIKDINKIILQPQVYDFVVARSSLHHFVELEHIFFEINKALKSDGQLLVIGEVIGRNGLQLYKETEELAQKIFDVIPENLRYNNYTKVIDTKVPNINHAEGAFEAIRSEEIFPLLTKSFRPREFVTIDAFTSLLLDFRYGPNYDITNKLHRAIADFIVQLDLHYVQNKILKPTCLFGIFEENK